MIRRNHGNACNLFHVCKILHHCMGGSRAGPVYAGIFQLRHMEYTYTFVFHEDISEEQRIHIEHNPVCCGSCIPCKFFSCPHTVYRTLPVYCDLYSGDEYLCIYLFRRIPRSIFLFYYDLSIFCLLVAYHHNEHTCLLFYRVPNISFDLVACLHKVHNIFLFCCVLYILDIRIFFSV